MERLRRVVRDGVALTLIRDFPEHLRSVILGSSFALQTDVIAQSSRSITLAFQRLIDACAADTPFGGGTATWSGC